MLQPFPTTTRGTLPSWCSTHELQMPSAKVLSTAKAAWRRAMGWRHPAAICCKCRRYWRFGVGKEPFGIVWLLQQPVGKRIGWEHISLISSCNQCHISASCSNNGCIRTRTKATPSVLWAGLYKLNSTVLYVVHHPILTFGSFGSFTSLDQLVLPNQHE